MKRLLSPSFLALVVVAFFLPFISISCNTQGLQEGLGGLGELGEGLGGEELDIPQENLEVTATGLQIILNDVDEPEGAGELGELGPTDPAGGSGDFPGRIFAILAAAAALLGLGLAFLRDKMGAIAATVAGLAAALFLFLMKSSIDGEIGPAQALGFQVSYKLGYWLALLFAVAAGAAGIWRLASERAVVVAPAAGTPPPPIGTPPEGPPPTAPPPTEPPPA